MKRNRSVATHTTKWMCVTALLMGMNVVLSSFSLPVPGGHLYLNDVVICTASILMDPLAAFLIGGVGAFLGDLLFYPLPMFVSLVSHGAQAVAISLIAHGVWKKRPMLAAAVGVTVGAWIMVTGYTFGRAFIYSTPAQSIIKLPYEILQAAVGAICGMLLSFAGGIRSLYARLMRP